MMTVEKSYDSHTTLHHSMVLPDGLVVGRLYRVALSSSLSVLTRHAGTRTVDDDDDATLVFLFTSCELHDGHAACTYELLEGALDSVNEESWQAPTSTVIATPPISLAEPVHPSIQLDGTTPDAPLRIPSIASIDESAFGSFVATPDSRVLYIVDREQTVYNIARRFEISPTELVQCNATVYETQINTRTTFLPVRPPPPRIQRPQNHTPSVVLHSKQTILTALHSHSLNQQGSHILWPTSRSLRAARARTRLQTDTTQEQGQEEEKAEEKVEDQTTARSASKKKNKKSSTTTTKPSLDAHIGALDQHIHATELRVRRLQVEVERTTKRLETAQQELETLQIERQGVVATQHVVDAHAQGIVDTDDAIALTDAMAGLEVVEVEATSIEPIVP